VEPLELLAASKLGIPHCGLFYNGLAGCLIAASLHNDHRTAMFCYLIYMIIVLRYNHTKSSMTLSILIKNQIYV
jgi:hypothetical protein